MNRLEKIDRDLEEIANLQGALQEDRQYSARLRESLQEEALRLRELRHKIESQVIRNPPASLAAALDRDAGQPVPAGASSAKASALQSATAWREPEVILPGGAHTASAAEEDGPSLNGKAHSDQDPQQRGRNGGRAPARKSGADSSAPQKSAAASRKDPRADAKASRSEAEEDFSFRFIQK